MFSGIYCILTLSKTDNGHSEYLKTPISYIHIDLGTDFISKIDLWLIGFA